MYLIIISLLIIVILINLIIAILDKNEHSAFGWLIALLLLANYLKP